MSSGIIILLELTLVLGFALVFGIRVRIRRTQRSWSAIDSECMSGR